MYAVPGLNADPLLGICLLMLAGAALIILVDWIKRLWK